MPPSSPGRRVAERRPSMLSRILDRALLLVPDRGPGRAGADARLFVAVGGLLLAGGVVLLGCALAGLGPEWLERVGALLVGTVYVAALAGRLGGRPTMVGLATAAVGGAVLVSGSEMLRSGAAVLVTVAAGVLGVMLTVPAVRVRQALREVVVALGVAAVGCFAAIGFGPVLDQMRFEYLTLALGLATSLFFVFRLGAGLHGLGKRGLVVVLIGGLLVVLTLAYTELLRQYGSQGAVEAVLSGVSWVREHLGAVPRPIAVFLGIPALMWGCHMRARRRQGWWVCAFGVAATIPVGHALMNQDASVLEALLGQAYTLVLGTVIGYAVIRADLILTGSRGARAQRAEEASAVRPEPRRLQPLQ